MNTKLQTNVANRERLVADLRRELMGPSSGRESLGRDYPRGRYGVGILFPACYVTGKVTAPPAPDPTTTDGEPGPGDGQPRPAIESFGRPSREEEARENDDDDPNEDGFDLALANSRQPASLAISFLLAAGDDAGLQVNVTGGYYEQLGPSETQDQAASSEKAAPQAETTSHVNAPAKPTAGGRHWCRVPVAPGPVVFPCGGTDGVMHARVVPPVILTVGPLKLEVLLTSRGYEEGNGRLLTVSLINRSEPGETGALVDSYCLFQSRLEVEVIGADGRPAAAILPYPEVRAVAGPADSESARVAVEEEESLALLYRDQLTFAIGHGCAADWAEPSGNSTTAAWAEVLPVVEVNGLTPDIRLPAGPDGRRELFRVAMAPLAGQVPGDDGLASVRGVVAAYHGWINEQAAAVDLLPGRHRETAKKHIDQARACAARMDDGLEFLAGSADARQAFRLANEAVRQQQLRGGKAREVAPAKEYNRLHFPDPVVPTGAREGSWRPFQIAFILMNLRSSIPGNDAFRENVELIWFPTGGGKTEAYLGLTAFAVFYDYLARLDGGPVGTQVLMRYTLRLLTAQQFQRASRLLCAMEYLRANSEDPRLNQASRISIGLWLGSGTTPNHNSDAVAALRALENPKEKSTRNPLLLTQCPWCRARMGPVTLRGTNAPRTLGYRNMGTRVEFVCPDTPCSFGKTDNPLPVYVTDEDIYTHAPTLVIGTVDKFARLAHVPRARALFGLDEQGQRRTAPPNLIIQDELHLVAGPLGSIVGLFEGLLEELCTDRRGEQPIRPKLICSTATIRRYRGQVQALYARDRVTLFPPPGLSSTDSFFSAPDTDEWGKPLPGRLYVGVHAPGHSSPETTQVRTFSALLYAAQQFSTDEERDPWWTLLLFYNSLHELGGAITLFNSDIVEYLGALARRAARASATPPVYRFLDRIIELTGRIASDEVVRIIERLERKAGERPGPVDACLASNIIEVGVDIDRLSVIGVVNQPKTTAQYIQVTGRVGRRAGERPGLVVTLYSTRRPRDRSHYEQFRSYHQRLYAQVEPTGLTPFSPPALDRALHGMLIAWIRQALPVDIQPDMVEDVITPALGQFRDLVLLPRVRKIAPRFEAATLEIFQKRLLQWQTWQPAAWENRRNKDAPPTIGLTYPAGEIEVENATRQWPLLGSMRNVDATSELRVAPLPAAGA